MSAERGAIQSGQSRPGAEPGAASGPSVQAEGLSPGLSFPEHKFGET